MNERAPCAHCGLPTAARRARDGSGPFCCLGCQVAQGLAQAGDGALASDRLLARVVLSAFLAMGVMVSSLALYGGYLSGGDAGERGSAAARALEGLTKLAALALSLPVALLLGVPLARAVVRGGRWLSAEALIALGAAAAYAVSLWNTLAAHGPVYFETATMVLVLVALGRWLDTRAKERARAHLAPLADELQPPARRVRDEVEEPVPVERLVLGDRVRVRPGEPVPVDGRVLEGRAFLDVAALTGESRPQAAQPGARVLAGALALDGALLVEAEAVGGGRVRDEVERLLEEALGRRGSAVRLADRLAAVLMPLALLLALGTFAATLPGRGLEAALMAALAVVLVSCPCALGIATPLAFWTALGAAWRRGVLVRGADVLEALARVRRVALDKTGTLTRPRVELVGLSALDGLDEDGVLARAAALEAHSEHPIAAGVRRAWAARRGAPPLPAVGDLAVLPGVGVAGHMDGARWELRSATDDDGGETTRVELREDGRRRAVLHLAAALEPEAARAVARLRLAGLEPRVLTGDGRGPARALERQLAVPVEPGLLPADKVARVTALGPRVAYVGEGLNDAAALAAADVGIALAHGSPRSLAVADVTLLGPGVEAVPDLLRLARRALSAARLNLAWATGYNLVGWWLAATGRLTPVAAAAAMVLSSAAVVLGSRRADRWDAAPTRSGGSSSPAPRSAGSPAPLPSPGPGA